MTNPEQGTTSLLEALQLLESIAVDYDINETETTTPFQEAQAAIIAILPRLQETFKLFLQHKLKNITIDQVPPDLIYPLIKILKTKEASNHIRHWETQSRYRSLKSRQSSDSSIYKGRLVKLLPNPVEATLI